MTSPLMVHSLCKQYIMGSERVEALSNASITVGRGEVCLIMGPSGSGKTTLLSIVGCVLRPTSGEVTIDGVAVSRLSERGLPRVRREKIGYIFQSFNLLRNLTALENVALTAKLRGLSTARANEKAHKLLVALGLGERETFRPDRLSGGERQRVAIARAIANEPSLIVADEPTANLDSRTGHAVAVTIRDLAKTQERAVIIASHDERLLEIADSLYHLEDGKLRRER